MSQKDVAISIEVSDPLSSSVQKDTKKKALWGKKKGDSEIEKKEPEQAVPFLHLWHFADSRDRLMIFAATILSMCIGALMPASIIVLGSFLDVSSSALGGTSNFPDLKDPKVIAKLTKAELDYYMSMLSLCPDGVSYKINLNLDSMYGIIVIFVYFGIAIFVAGYFSQMFWVLTGENQTRNIRQKYVHAILRQDQSWFDKNEDGSLATRLAQDTQLIQDGISEKAGLTVQSITGFIAGMVVAFVKGWRLALVLLAALPVLGIVGSLMIFVVTKYVKKGQDSYADAGAIAEQVVSGIRTVYAFSLQTRFQEKYQIELEKAYKSDLKKGQAIGTGFGVFMFTIFSTYGLAFYYGSRLVLWGDITPGNVLVVFMSILMGAFSLITLPPNLSAISSARGAAFKIFGTISRVPEIDTDNDEGAKPEQIQGSIQFTNVNFAYPTRPDITILNNLTLEVKPGMTVAFVGPSGSGKSTSVALVQRFYDVISGSVSIDGINIKDYNVKYLRENIGVVSQEPILFNTTIKQNILMGAVRPVTESDLITACKLANCHNFISSLPNGYDTITGESGSQLSGGQKQRIAIARALIRDPKILLLDEATSALDTQSERIVQKALDTASKNRTTIVIAHRLSTIKNADIIVVMAKGNIIEKGTHNELLALGKTYYQLVEKQKIKLEVEKAIRSGDTETTEESEIEEYGKIDDNELSQVLAAESADMAKQNIRTDFIDTDTGKTVEIFLKLDDKATFKELEKIKKQREAELLANQKKEKAPLARVLKLMKSEWPLLFTGLLGASVAGAVFPIFSLIFTKVLTILNQPANIDPGPFQGANLYSFLF
ncbi:ATP-binding cassette, sub-B (MDR TAP), member 4, partial [Nowakowskiella sp. JEL0078]